jgi:hypothetical protein
MLERKNDAEIMAAVNGVLQRCGAGCTDLTSAAVVGDPTLLRQVLVLQQLDEAAAAAAAAHTHSSVEGNTSTQ